MARPRRSSSVVCVRRCAQSLGEAIAFFGTENNLFARSLVGLRDVAVILFEQAVEGAAADAQRPGRLYFVPLDLSEDFLDVAALDLAEIARVGAGVAGRRSRLD